MKTTFENKVITLILTFFTVNTSLVCAQREFWGIAQGIENNYQGVIFKLDSVGSNFQVVYSFDSTCFTPKSITLGGNGKLYITRPKSAINLPSKLFEFDVETGSSQSWDFFNDAPSFSSPTQGKLLEEDGYLYGATDCSANWNTGQRGKMYRFNLTTHTFEIRINNSTFLRPWSGMVKASNGLLFGLLHYIQFSSSEFYFGGLYSYNPVNNTFNYRVRFGEFGESLYPNAELTLHPNGKIYGTCYGSSVQIGAIFEFDPITNAYSEINSPQKPVGGLCNGPNGKLYGASYFGGEFGNGTLYEYDPILDTVQVKQNLYNPRGELLLASNNKMYGFAENFVYEYDPLADTLIVRHQFQPNNLGYYDTPTFGSIIETCKKPKFAPIDQDTITACENQFFNIVIQSNNTAHYRWQKNGVSIFAQQDSILSILSPTFADTGYYYCKLSNVCGETLTDTFYLKILPENTINQDITICDGESLTVGNETYSQPGIFSAFLTAQNGCDSIVTTNLTVNDLNAEIVSEGLQLSASNQPSNAQYQWVNCDENYVEIIGEINPDYTVIANGSYAVIVEQNECRDTSECVAVTTVGLSKPKYDKIDVYPNPADEYISILSNEKSQTVNIYTSSGQLIYLGDLNQHQKEISVKNWANGIYILKIGAIHSKITIQH